jgi:predicted nucleic acid-binding protein
LEAAGTPIGAYDLLIASHALVLDLMLVTANAEEFGHVLVCRSKPGDNFPRFWRRLTQHAALL